MEVLPSWKKGDRFTLQLSRQKKKWEETLRKDSSQLTWLADVEVKEAGIDSYRFHWTHRLTDSFLKTNPLASVLLPAYQGLVIDYSTEQDGSFRELHNWQEVAAVFTRMARGMTNANDTAKAIMDKVGNMFATREMAEASLIREIQLYHAVCGGLFTRAGLENSTALPNPLGGEPLPAFMIQRLSSNDPDAPFFEVSFDQQIDPRGMEGIIRSLADKMGIRNDTMMQEVRKLITGMVITDKARYLINRKTGRPEKLLYLREVSVASMRQEETYEILLLPEKGKNR